MYMAFLALMLALLWPNQVVGASLQAPSFSQVKIRGNTAGDEFIELYNPLEQGVELSGFKLVKKRIC